MEYLIFVAWLVFFAWLVTKVPFFTKSGLNESQVIIVFLLKVMAGILYGWIGVYYGGLAQMVDTWNYHYNGIQEYHLLQTNPREFFTNLLNDPYEGGFLKFFGNKDSFWNDLKSNALIKILSIFDVLSFGYYYVNVIFYSFLTLFGPVCCFRVMNDVFPGRKLAIAIATFLVPSFLYWTSGIHKDGLTFTGIMFIIYGIYFGLKSKKFDLKKILMILLGFFILLIFRNYIIVIIAPALLAWLLSVKWPKHGLTIFAGIYILFIILFFTVRYIKPGWDFPQAVVNKQEAFMQLHGNSYVPIKKLEPTAISFLKNIPQALTLSTIRPYPGDVNHILSLAAAVEIDLLIMLALLFFLFRTNGALSKNFIYFCIFFSFSILLTIGYTVNFLGAIVRYRSIVIPLLIVPIVSQIDWKRLGKVIFN
ncbi:MAG: hypothetical protein IT214_03055 [Chitinophagaceae bacterium]|nr:hypothetical protein [Chitinophagaceae bacterium]OQY97001.1 MAG: hypothetical protein B6D37_00445 [Sphingobacteriales bacterium UTBCD1]